MLGRVVAYLRRAPQIRLNVVGTCPTTHARVATHAHMTRAELARFDRSLALFCPACRKAHQFTRADLSLSADGRLDLRPRPADAST